MKESDLTGAKLLKVWLSIGYHDYEISGEKDICTLVRMCLKSGVSAVFMIAFLLVIGCAILAALALMFSFLTLYLPEAYYADIGKIAVGVVLLALSCVVALLGFTIEVVLGKRKFAPEYMKRPIRKLFKKIGVDTVKEDISDKETKPSATWIACKEMYRSVKEKTCIKVKL